MEPQELRIIDKSGWERGPWDDEPDRVEWRCHGLPCLIVRNQDMGNLCGYVGVPPGHPWYGKSYKDVPAEAHGGVTYSDPCDEGGTICHVPQPGEPDAVWWFGFDAAHAFDLKPGQAAMLRLVGMRPMPHHALGVYRDIFYVRGEVEGLALQAHSAAREACAQEDAARPIHFGTLHRSPVSFSTPPPVETGDCTHSSVSIDRAQGTETCDDCGVQPASVVARPLPADVANYRTLSGESVTVHILAYGRSLCNMQGLPCDWPTGHLWVSFVDEVNLWAASCPECLERKAEALK